MPRIELLADHPGLRGEGLGRMLMLHVQAADAEIGVSRLYLHTRRLPASG